MNDLKRAISEVKNCIENAEANNAGLEQSNASIVDFKASQQAAYRTTYQASIDILTNEIKKLDYLKAYDNANIQPLDQISKLLIKLREAKQTSIAMTIIGQIELHAAELEFPDLPETNIELPDEIKDEINADINEIKKCITTNCNRSAIILCGRVLETALHRKYYEATGNDLLEKAPGTGLGNIVAKLAEKQIVLDPAMGNQIHLINQLRIFSVHTKKQPYQPTREQAQAVFLYTQDILRKLWAVSGGQ